MKKSQSIQKILLTTYWGLMLVILLLVSSIFTIIEYSSMRKNITDNLQQTCDTISQSVGDQLNLMNSISINILYSAQLIDAFENYFSSPDGRERLIAGSTMNNLLYSLRGTSNNIRQIILYDLTQGSYCMGNYNGYQDITVSEMPWYEDTLSMDGLAFYPLSAPNPLLSASAGTNTSRPYTSLCRVFFDKFHKPLGIMEVMQYEDVTFSRAINHGSNYNISIYIYDSQGNLAYPLGSSSEDTFDYLSISDLKEESIYNSVLGRWEYVYFSPIPGCGFTTVVAIDRIAALSPVIRYLITMLLIFLIASVICYFVARRISRELASPLVFMYNYLDHMDFQNKWKVLQMPDSNVLEIDKLRDSLNEFQEHQINSLNSLMLLKEQEMQAQMLALQSQTNPHFLYNALATVTAMAEEGMTEGIRQMCLDITAILRYISSNKHPLSTLEEELEHCDRYLNCLKLRFGESLHYTIDVPDEMLELMIPKLSIQLLVENAVKFTSRTAPPWHITICGQIIEPIWIVEVLDNGPGFSSTALQKLEDQIEVIKEHGLLPSLELDGMGLMNIYIRYYMIYKNGFIFNAGTLSDGGAIVTIGGKCV